MTPWEHLADLAEAEVALAREGRWEELPAALEARAAASQALGPAPADAREALTRLAAAHGRLLAMLATGRADTAAELARMRKGRSAVRGYAGAGAASGGRRLGVA